MKTYTDYIREFGSSDAAFNAFFDGKVDDPNRFESLFMSPSRARSALVSRAKDHGYSSLTEAVVARLRGDFSDANDPLLLGLVEKYAPETLTIAAAIMLDEAAGSLRRYFGNS